MPNLIGPDLLSATSIKKCSISRAGICFNLKKGSGSDDEEEFDDMETISFLKAQLETFGLKAALYEQDEHLVKRLQDEKPEFIFNIAEGIGASRTRESQVPAVLDWLGIPYYGSDALALGVTLDKWMTNVLLSHGRLPTPRVMLITETHELNAWKAAFDGTRYIVKPRWEGSSKGVFLNSVVHDLETAKERASFIIERYKQPAIVEEFIDGEEVTVGVIGNHEPKVLGMMKISAKDNPTGSFVYSIEYKRDWQEKIKYEKASDVMPHAVIEKIGTSVLGAFKRLELKDAARIDLRINKEGIPVVIDVNPLPGLSPVYSDLMLMSRLHGMDFSDVVRCIMHGALTRHGLFVL
jgi:D-alanine-D-alanine ligase